MLCDLLVCVCNNGWVLVVLVEVYKCKGDGVVEVIVCVVLKKVWFGKDVGLDLSWF